MCPIGKCAKVSPWLPLGISSPRPPQCPSVEPSFQQRPPCRNPISISALTRSSWTDWLAQRAPAVTTTQRTPPFGGSRSEPTAEAADTSCLGRELHRRGDFLGVGAVKVASEPWRTVSWLPQLSLKVARSSFFAGLGPCVLCVELHAEIRLQVFVVIPVYSACRAF